MNVQSLILACFCIMLISCKGDEKVVSQNKKTAAYSKIIGKTMGTTYSIIYDNTQGSIKKNSIDSILEEINLSVSTYIDSSTISKVNKPSSDFEEITVLENGRKATQQRISISSDVHFKKNYEAALEVWRQSDGYFDPTVMPLVNYWGFGYTPKNAVSSADSAKLKTLLELVGMEKFTVSFHPEEIVILKPQGTQLDFSAIAKGYAVDVLADYMMKKGVKNMMVEIGGEMTTRGINPDKVPWKVGLNKPKPEASLNEISEIIQLSDISLASSGNYRIFHEVNGKKYGHELNPKTGYPEISEVLGVSILAPTCMEADAVATACMIMGLNNAMTFIEDRLHLEGCFFTSDAKGEIISHRSSGFSAFLHPRESH